MNVGTSAYTQSLYAYNTNVRTNAVTSAEDDDDSTSVSSSSQDTVSISQASLDMLNQSSGTRPPKPPEEMDFENMSDEELVSYVKQMQEMTGNVPGMDGDTDIDSLSTDQLSSLRDTLTEMSANPPQGGQGAGPVQGGPPPAAPVEDDEEDEDEDETDVLNMTAAELREYLEELEQQGGKIPGKEDDTAVSELSEDDLANIRSMLMSTGTA